MTILSVFLILALLIPFLPFKHWFFAAFEFGRVLFLCLGVLAVILYVADLPAEPLQMILFGLVVLSTAWQARVIFPYTPLAPVQSAGCSDPPDLCILWANVLQTNENKAGFVRLLDVNQPDVFITLESDHKWEAVLDAFAKAYPFRVKVPQDNLYGMHLYSRLKIVEEQVMYLVDDRYPSIRARLQLENGRHVQLICIHPPPPAPMERSTSVARDGELMVAARMICNLEGPVIVCGDLNDVAWSDIGRLFQRVAGLLDPRKGRGLFNTFHAWYPLLRAPIDHVFHSHHFKLHAIRRLPKFGSDHFAMYCSLCLDRQSAPDADAEEEHLMEAEEKISAAQEAAG
ncbi:MAG: endonuclease/exonuclease/phosphatase family protein [Saprospiraceae bacterium]|nr:endonuclease/exonuclease/phosphatase family protein [Saprospiraceae bacterium]